MENELETLIRKVAIDKTDFDNKIQNVQKVARYTKEELDQIEVVKMDMNILNIERKLLVVKELLKNPELTTLEIKSLSMDKKGLERELSESKRTMNNYLNTGNKEVSRTTQLFNGLRKQIIPLGAVNIAGTVISKLSQLAKGLWNIAANFDEIEEKQIAFKRMSEVFGPYNDVMQELRTSTKGLISDVDLWNGANVLMAKGVVSSSEQLGSLMKSTQIASKILGSSVEQVNTQLSLILTNNSVMRLDSIGVSIKEVADKLGIADSELDTFAKNNNEAFDTAVIEVYTSKMSVLNEGVETSSMKMQRVKVAYQNLSTLIGSRLQPVYDALVGVISRLSMGFAEMITLFFGTDEAMSKDVKSADTLSLALEELTKKKNILSEVEYNSARAELISEAKAAITNAKAMVALAQAKQMAVKLQNTGQGKLDVGAGAIATIGGYTTLDLTGRGEAQKEVDKWEDELKASMDVLKDIEKQTEKVAVSIGKGSGGGDATKKLKDELTKQRNVEIQAVQDSTLSQEEKYKKILEISEKYDQEIVELEGKTQDELIKEAKEAEKERMEAEKKAAEEEVKLHQDKYKKLNSDLKNSQKEVEKYNEEIKKLFTEQLDYIDELSDSIRGFNQEVKELNSEYEIDNAKRYIELKKELAEPTDDNTDREERNKLQKEYDQLVQVTTEEQRRQVEEYEKLTEFEKRQIEHQEKLLAIEEQRAITQALINTAEKEGGSGIKYEMQDDGSYKGFYIDEKGEEKEVTDYKNIQYLIDLKNKQNSLNEELKEVQTKLAIEQQLYVDMNNQRIEMEETLTEELAEQIEERKSEQDDYVEHFRKKANEQVDIARITAEQMQAYALAYQEALASMNMSGGSSSPMTTNNTLNQTNIINNPSDQSFVQAMTNRISPV